MYDYLHWLHAGLAVLSGSGFVVRATWRIVGCPLADLRVVRVLPHLVDTLLLLLGVILAVWSQRVPLLYPGDHAWLGAKLLALLGYIALGLLALRFARSQAQRLFAFAGALGCFGYMLAVATTRQVLPWVALAP